MIRRHFRAAAALGLAALLSDRGSPRLLLSSSRLGARSLDGARRALSRRARSFRSTSSPIYRRSTWWACPVPRARRQEDRASPLADRAVPDPRQGGRPRQVHGRQCQPLYDRGPRRPPAPRQALERRRSEYIACARGSRSRSRDKVEGETVSTGGQVLPGSWYQVLPTTARRATSSATPCASTTRPRKGLRSSLGQSRPSRAAST